MRQHGIARIGTVFLVLGVVVCAPGCRRDMQDQPKYRPMQESRFFADGRTERPIPPGTVATDALQDDDSFHTGWENGDFLDHIPAGVTIATLERGHERYDIFCSECHGRIGDGNGMVKRRGLKWPANLHTDRLRHAPPGYLYQVIRNGYGAMQGYDAQIPPDDRWAIVSYIRALQLSRDASLDDLPSDARAALEAQR